MKCAFFASIALALAAAGCASAPPAPAAAPAAAGCLLIVQGVVTDRDGFRTYVAALPPLYVRFGGTYLAIARNPDVLEGAPAFESLVVSRWPSCDAVRAFWASPEYRELAQRRQAWGRFDVVIAPMLPAAARD